MLIPDNGKRQVRKLLVSPKAWLITRDEVPCSHEPSREAADISMVASRLTMLKNVFGPGRGWPLIAADEFHQPRGKAGDSCDLSARHGNSGNQCS
jgi:hypothetical protein